MKCPKCHYLSFDPEPRCRNCGYTLALDPDLAIHPADESQPPLVDLTLRDAEPAPAAPPDPAPSRPVRRPAAPGAARRPRTSAPGPFDAGGEPADLGEGESSDADQVASPAEQAVERPRRSDSPAAETELPLFVQGLGDPLVAPAAAEPARPPAGGSSRRISEQAKFGPLDRDLLEGLQRIERAQKRKAEAEAERALAVHPVLAYQRLLAAVIDAALLGALAVAVVFVTLRWSGLDWSQVWILPLAPVAAFLLIVVVGYLFMFTAASGQTAGKMFMGIRVVDATQEGVERVSIRQALYRGALTVPSVLLLGAGLLPAFVADGRAIHDRLARTRVVRA